METARFATFVSALPDDSVKEGDEIVRPNGHNVAENIAAYLREKGFHISVVQQYSFYGWTFEGSVNRVSFWCLLGYAEPWLLIVKDRRWFGKRWFGSVEPFISVLKELDLVMNALDDISEVKWFTPSDYESSKQQTNGEE